MKLIVLVILLMSVFTGTSQKGYWQQHVEYTMNIDMDVKTNRFTGEQELIYKNNSPDTLTKVFLSILLRAGIVNAAKTPAIVA